MKIFMVFVTVMSIMLMIGCGGGDEATIESPSVSGKVYNMTIESGEGVFAQTGGYTVAFRLIQTHML